MANGWGGRRTNSGPKRSHPHGRTLLERQLCLYVLAEEGSARICKVGVTDRLHRRVAQLQTGNWRKLTPVAAFRVYEINTATEIESRLLTFYAPHVVKGEWISEPPADVAATLATGIKSIGLPVENLIDEAKTKVHLINFERKPG